MPQPQSSFRQVSMQDQDEAHAQMAAQKEIRELLSRYERSLNESNASIAVSCYAPDGMFMPTTLPTASGHELGPAYDQIFANIRLAVLFTIDELVVTSDDTAYALTRSNGTQTVLATGAQSAESNREIFTFKRINGDWKIHRYMFNKPN